MKNTKIKILGIAVGLGLMLSACSSGTYTAPGVDRRQGANVVDISEEEEHELIIIDPGYNRWAVTHARPIGFYSPWYYRQWNQRYVQAWNALANQAARYAGADFPFENQINYDLTTDYGVELDYELFTYFQYIATRYSGRYGFPRPVAGYLGT